MIDLDEGRMGSQRLGLELWSESLDPVRPDGEGGAWPDSLPAEPPAVVKAGA